MAGKSPKKLTTYKETRWTAEIDKNLFRMPRIELSIRYGISPAAIRKRRRELRDDQSSREKQPKWTRAQDKLLGTIPDTELAEKLGTSKFLVRQRRILKGVAAYEPEEPPEAEIVHRPPINLTKKQESLLGTQPDPVLAERWDVAPSVLTRYRNELGIPPFQNGKPVEWTTGMLNLLGEVPDTKLAAEYEISYSAVRIKRIWEGIKPYNKEHMDPEPDLPLDVTHKIGKVPDAKLARMFGVSRFKIQIYRALHKIPLAEYEKPTLHRWTAKEDKLLGTMSDRRVAVQLGVPYYQVFYRRRKLGIAPYGVQKEIEWEDAMIAELGKLPDAQLARLWNCSQVAIREKREELGIPACKKTTQKLAAKRVKQLGTVSDSVLAREWGVSVSFVTQQRNQRKIPPCHKVKKLVLTKSDEKLLGKVPDVELAIKLGVAASTIAQRRQERGIPAKRTIRKVDWDSPKIRKQLGKKPDSEIAEQFGVCRTAVQYARKSRGIPGYRP